MNTYYNRNLSSIYDMFVWEWSDTQEGTELRKDYDIPKHTQ